MQGKKNSPACRYSGLGPFSARFWDAAAAKRFTFQFDATVDRPQFYPRPVGIGSGSQSLSWKQATGKGRVVAVTTVSIWRDQPEYALVVVDMREGFRVVAKCMEPAETVPIGSDVEVVWLADNGANSPLFAFKRQHR